MPIVVEKVDTLPGYHLYRPQDLTAPGAPLPVITWADGGCLRWDDTWKSLLSAWAAHGYVVLAPTAPDGIDPRTAGATTVADQAAAIDWAAKESTRPGSPYAGHLDLDHVVAAGNSCGGVTALQLAAQDKRVKSVFVLSGSSVLPGSTDAAAAAIMSKIDVPVAWLTGGAEDISVVNAQRDYRLLPAGVPGYLAHRATGTHPQVSTDPAILDEDAQISTAWITYSLGREPQLEQQLTQDPCHSCAAGTWTVQAKDLGAV
jgi:dienelactone hydrolase